MYIIDDLISMLRDQIGDNDLEDPNITNSEMERILSSSATEYSKLRRYIKIKSVPYEPNSRIINTPEDCYKVLDVKLGTLAIDFIDNIDQIILEKDYDIKDENLNITYSKYFNPEDIPKREINIFLMHAEALCYKLMASKTAEGIKFSTGEKMVDESGLSEKYLDLYKSSVKSFRKMVIKAYGKKGDHPKENLDFNLPFPVKGENI